MGAELAKLEVFWRVQEEKRKEGKRGGDIYTHAASVVVEVILVSLKTLAFQLSLPPKDTAIH